MDADQPRRRGEAPSSDGVDLDVEGILLNDGSRMSPTRLDQIVAEALAEGEDLLNAASPHAPLPPGMNEYEAAVDAMLHDAHVAAPHEVPALVARHAAVLGATQAVTYLADLQQNVLVPFLGSSAPGVELKPLAVDTTLAGRAFQHVRVLTQSLPDEAAGLRVWLPLLDSTERLGVLGLTIPAGTSAYELHHGALGRRLGRLASLTADLVVTKTFYGDTIVKVRRHTAMDLAAELHWSLLPPLIFSGRQVTIAAAFEPAYNVAGDAVDYAVDAGWARFGIFDGMGHDLQSAHLSALTVAAYRNSRRAGRSLTTTARTIDDAVQAFWSGEGYCSGLLAELDTTTGRLSWINAGHPEPLVLRDRKLVRSLHVEPGLPFGLGPTPTPQANEYTVGTYRLQPGDQVVLYTDGVTDARDPDGAGFGVRRLVDLLTRTDDPLLPPPEKMRRLVRALLEHQRGRLTDDATLLSVTWRSDSEQVLLP